ncbi:MAG: hypothetical protein PHQ19_05145 [Candidatus Krumholzibacteria bacterium]|nr:hypothetical protein [Candidatus Krumholzibacteria bacterium]
MRRFNSKNSTGLFVFATLAAALVLPACRQEPEPLDRNRAPETYLTVAPPETTNAEYRVHLYWHGEDRDGIVQRYIWYRSDTLRTLRPDLEPELDLLDWNPEARKEDYLRGRFTSASDTVIVFTGFDVTTGAMLNRQAFHIAAVDDGGRIDQTPARIQFFAQVKCIPEVEFWIESETIEHRKYVPGDLDTISMYEPFCVEFVGETCNNIITGYQWIYGGKVRPDYNNDGVPDWYIPATSPPETVQVCLPNRGVEALPEGDFYLRVIARDEAGALSRADLGSGEWVCQVVINHDPDTRILFGENYSVDMAGVPRDEMIDFDDGLIDTLPYNSRLRMHYIGWDDSKDSLQYTNPPLPMRFQFKFERWGYGLSGGVNSYKPAWMPEAKAEDTNCNSEEDSTTMRVGSYEYLFLAKAFDEQYRYDHTPDTVRFFGNFRPTIDNVAIAWDSIPYSPTYEFRKADSDTLYIGIDKAMTYRGDTCTAYSVQYDPATRVFSLFYRFFIVAGGHDDRRDPPGSAVRGWLFSIDAAEDYYFRKENEYIYAFPPDTFYQDLTFRLVVPQDPDFTAYPRPDPDFLLNPPLWMGEQSLSVIATDLLNTAKFKEEIRGISPQFVNKDPCDALISLGSWVSQERAIANYARTDTYQGRFYIKLVY